ncbi:hypothetical protein KKG58_03070, partial [Patescibacteria group bacterium]|nr:hypothetical protein [Patescibacteria group bacterium]
QEAIQKGLHKGGPITPEQGVTETVVPSSTEQPETAPVVPPESEAEIDKQIKQTQEKIKDLKEELVKPKPVAGQSPEEIPESVPNKPPTTPKELFKAGSEGKTVEYPTTEMAEISDIKDIATLYNIAENSPQFVELSNFVSEHKDLSIDEVNKLFDARDHLNLTKSTDLSLETMLNLSKDYKIIKFDNDIGFQPPSNAEGIIEGNTIWAQNVDGRAMFSMQDPEGNIIKKGFDIGYFGDKVFQADFLQR